MKGSYILVIENKKDIIIKVGKLGNLSFKKGFYAYVGSALNGLENRIQRHLNSQKKLHWHIDYFLKFGKIIKIYYKENETSEECTIAKKLSNNFKSVPFFGCSDCNCRSHLFYGSKNEIINLIISLDMIPFPLCKTLKTV